MKVLRIILIFVSVSLLIASCGGEMQENKSDESRSDSAVSETENTSTTDQASTDISEPDMSEDESEELPAYITNFISYAPISTTLRATDSTSIRLTGINKSAEYGDVILYTRDFGSNMHLKDGTYEDYAVLVCEYSHTYFGYVKTAVYNAGEDNNKSEIEIPEDGFIVLAHSAQESIISKLGRLDTVTPLFVHGVQIADVGFSISETSTPIEIDGSVGSEWSAFHIDSIDENNELWAYSSFEENNYYTTADYYMTYDSDYLYLAVVVNSPYHYCPITPSTANSMWQYECIQVKVVDQSPLSEFMLEHFDHITDQKAVNEGHVRSYGFAVNNEGETCYYESGISTTFEGLASVVRDDGAQTTTYEVAIPWSEYGINIYELTEIGVTFSINSTNEEDIETGNWRNLILRDGGGVIGRNDWSKIPVVSLNLAE